MEGSLLGLGVKNIVGLFIVIVLGIVVLKVVSIKFEKTPAGLRDIIQTI